MKKKWLIDTDVLIDYLRGFTPSVEFIERIGGADSYISAITVAELYVGVRDEKERHDIETFLSIFEIISIDEDVAREGGLYRRSYGKSHGVGLADTLIAACAEQSGARLVTLNKKHFPMLKNVFVPYEKNNS